MFNIPTVTVASETLTSTAASVTLTYAAPAGVAWTPRHLVLRWNARSSESMSGERGVSFRFNGDTGSNYNEQRIDGAATTADALRATSATQFNNLGVDTGDSAPANGFSSGEILLPDALSTRSHKSVLGFAGAIEQRLRVGAGRWANTAAITSITATQDGYGEFKIGSTFELCVVDESFNIDEQIKTSTGSITVSSISAGDGDIVQIGNVKSARTSAIANTFSMRLNGDSGNVYDTQNILAVDTNVFGQSGTYTYGACGFAPASAAGAHAKDFGAFLSLIPNYADGSRNRTMTSLTGYHIQYPYSLTGVITNLWRGTAAVNSILLYNTGQGEFVADTMLSTYVVPKHLIERIEITGDSEGAKTFSSIPQSYDHLELSIYARTDRANAVDDMYVQFNGDTTAANYFSQRLTGTDTTIGAANYTNAPFVTTVAAANAAANEFSSGFITLYNYSKTDRHKHHLSALGTSVRTGFNSDRWASTAAITSITLTPSSGSNFLTGTVLELRGISSTIVSASDITSINGIEIANITAVN